MDYRSGWKWKGGAELLELRGRADVSISRPVALCFISISLCLPLFFPMAMKVPHTLFLSVAAWWQCLLSPALCFTKTVKLDIGRSHKGSLSMEGKGEPQTVVFGQAGKQLLGEAANFTSRNGSLPLSWWELLWYCFCWYFFPWRRNDFICKYNNIFVLFL